MFALAKMHGVVLRHFKREYTTGIQICFSALLLCIKNQRWTALLAMEKIARINLALKSCQPLKIILKYLYPHILASSE